MSARFTLSAQGRTETDAWDGPPTGSARPIPGTGSAEMLTAERPFAACGKLAGTSAVTQGEMHVIGFVRHTQTTILSPN